MATHRDWKSHALCKNDKKSSAWLSYKKSDIDYAKEICSRCEVMVECLNNAFFIEKEFFGVNGGMSEYDFMIETWVEVNSERKSNWTRNRAVLQRLLQAKIKTIRPR